MIQRIPPLFVCIVLIVQTAFCQSFRNGNLIFEHISKEQGLLHAHVLCVTEDRQGYMWIGTFGGLHRYDGLSFDYYTHNDTIPGSLSNNAVHAVFEDSKGRIWVGTENELNLFIPSTNSFQKVKGESALFKNYSIREIIEDKNGLLWLATYGGGIDVVDPDKMLVLKNYREETGSVGGNFANTIFRDHSGRIWAGLESKGLQLYNPGKDVFSEQRIGLPDQTVNTIAEDKDGALWIGTWLGGLTRYNPATQALKNFSPDASDPSSIPDPTVRQITFDKYGMLWLATTNGLGCFNPKTETCITYRNNKSSLTSLAFNYLWSIDIDREGTIWIGTFGNGLCKLDQKRNSFDIINSSQTDCRIIHNYNEALTQDSKGRLWLAPNEGGIAVYASGKNCVFEHKIMEAHPQKKIRYIYEDRDGYIWLGTEDGVLRYSADLSQSTFISLRKNGLNGFSIFCIGEDKNGNLWLGGWNTGLLMLRASEKNQASITQQQLVIYNKQNTGALHIPTDIVWNVFNDAAGNLWVGADAYLLLLNEKTQQFETVLSDITNVFGIAEYPSGTLWVGTLNNGLVKLQNKKVVKSYSFPDVAGEITLYTIISANHSLWMGTSSGLYVFDPKQETLYAYTTLDGLPSNTFIRSAGTLMQDRSLLMATSDGLVRVFPESMSPVFPDPMVRISDIGLFNHSISLEHSAHPVLTTSLAELTELKLEYDQNMLSIDFSAMQHSLSSKLRFTYILEGFQTEWIETEGTTHKAVFTNLNPGEYTFRVYTLLPNGKKGSHEASFKLIILPPWWKTWWFRILVSVLISGAVIAFFLIRTRNITLRNKWLSDEVQLRTGELQEANISLLKQHEEGKRQSEKILDQQKELLDKKYALEKTNEQLAESNEFQNRLIGILGHDIRGPLQNFTLLLKHMDKGSEEWVIQKLKESAGSISSLANDLLDWITVQSGQQLQHTDFTWAEIIEKALKETEAARTEKKVSVAIHKPGASPIKGVLPVVQSTLRNILGNAIRFSKEGGILEIEGDIHREGFTGIRITDYGDGFNASEVNTLIKGAAFTGMRERSLTGGAGLGMAICYDMIKRTGGFIEAASLPGSGATFFIFLPVSSSSSVVQPVEVFEEDPAMPIQTSFPMLKGKKILLVDDDDEVRWVLVKSMADFGEIQEVRSAEEALVWLKDHTPDIAILDINMPGISGLELCRQIKHSADMAHVPCMIISGEKGENLRAEVFAAGADSFISKPLQPEEVLLQMSAYFENQERKLKRFFTENASIDQLTENPLNKVFLSGMVSLVEKNLNSGELNVDFLARHMGVSRSSLYRTLKSLTGQTVNDFIKNIRMRKSMTLLKEGKLNISEIAEETGFNSLSYFTTSFKKHFGFTPTELK